MTRASGTCATISKWLTFVSLETQKDRVWCQKRNNGWKLLKFVKRYKPTEQEVQQTPNKMHPQNIMPKNIIIKLPRTKDNNKNIESSQREKQGVT